MAEAHLFELDPDLDWAAVGSPPAQDPLLRFTYAGVEAEYLRFAHRTRALPLVLVPLVYSGVLLAFGVLYMAAGMISIAAGSLAVGLGALFVVVLWPWTATVAERRLQARLRDLVAPCLMLVIVARVALGYHDHVTCDSVPSGFDHPQRDYCLHHLLPAALLPAVLPLRPRFWQLVAGCALTVVAHVAGAVAAGVQSAAEIAAIAGVIACISPGLCWLRYAVESANRRHFTALVAAHGGRRTIATAVARTAKLLESAVPELVLGRLRTARSLSEALVQDTAPTATIGIVDVVDFAHWTTGLLPIDVVHVLHRLFTMYDDACPTFGVAKAATYADSYTVVAGLGVRGARALARGLVDIQDSSQRGSSQSGRPAPDSESGHDSAPSLLSASGVEPPRVVDCARSVVSVAQWQVEAAQSVSQALAPQRPFAVRGAVATGPLTGGIVGHTASLRYIVAGAAAAECWALLSATDAGVSLCPATWGLIAASAVTSAQGTTVSLATDPRPQEPAPQTTAVAVDAAAPGQVSLATGPKGGMPTSWANAAATTFTVDDAALELRGVAATFASSETELLFRHSEAGPAFRLCAASMAAPAMLYVAAFAVTAAERWAPSVGREGSDDIATRSIAGLAAVVALAGLRLGLLLSAGARVPHVVDTALAFLVFGGFPVALLGAGNTLAGNRVLYYTAFMSNCLHPLRPTPWWGLDAALVLAAVAVPNVVVSFMALEALTGEIALVLGASLLLVLQAHSNATEARAHYATRRVAAAIADDAHGRDRLLQWILHALLPVHVAEAYVRHQGGSPGDPLGGGGRELHRTWHDLTFVHVRFHPVRDGPPLAVAAQRLAVVARTVRSLGTGALEVLESKADTVLVAGAFDGAANMSAPRGALAFLRCLSTFEDLPFTAIVNAGSAYGALLGSDSLTYRLFGPGVRESNALMAAAPDVWGRNAAYASSSFRRQCEAAELHRQREERRAAGEVAPEGPPSERHLSELLGAASTTLARPIFDSSGGASAAAALRPMEGAADAVGREFGATLRWRSRGAGVAFVSVVRLDLPADLPPQDAPPQNPLGVPVDRDGRAVPPGLGSSLVGLAEDTERAISERSRPSTPRRAAAPLVASCGPVPADGSMLSGSRAAPGLDLPSAPLVVP